MKQMSLAQYRANVRIVGEKSALFEYKKEIFEAVEMSLSHSQIHSFLTSQKGLKISVRAVSKWIKTHKKIKSNSQITPSQKMESKQENSYVEPRVEPVSAPTQFNDLANDPEYARIFKVAQERRKMREEALKEKNNENHDS